MSQNMKGIENPVNDTILFSHFFPKLQEEIYEIDDLINILGSLTYDEKITFNYNKNIADQHKILRRTEIFNIIISVCDWLVENETESEKNNKIKDIIGSVLYNVICNSEKISDLKILNNKIKKKYSDKYLDSKGNLLGRVWIADTFIEKKINERDIWFEHDVPDKSFKWKKYSMIKLTKIMRIPYANLDCLRKYSWNNYIIDNLFIILLTKSIFKSAFGDDFYYLGYEDKIEADSRTLREFDGVIEFEFVKERPETYFLRTCTSHMNPQDTIECVKSDLEDIGKTNAIIFTPDFYTPEALRLEKYYTTKNYNMKLFYYFDFLQFLRIRNFININKYISYKVRI